jgi:hypothetical protein
MVTRMTRCAKQEPAFSFTFRLAASDWRNLQTARNRQTNAAIRFSLPVGRLIAAAAFLALFSLADLFGG